MLYGYTNNGFPSLFLPGTSQATITSNNVFMPGLIVWRATYWISEAEKRVDEARRAIVEVTRETEEAHSTAIVKRAPIFSPLAGCTPGHFNGHGQMVSRDPIEKD
jgi:hypothetical protein